MDYEVRQGDTLLAIAGRYGADWQQVARTNGLSHPDRIAPGRRLTVETRRIVPAVRERGVVINLPESMLYYFEQGRLVFQAGVGLGKPGRWRTPTGAFTIISKERHPTWEVPVSIQQEMEAEGRVVLKQVPPGPENPLGEFWLGLSIPGLRHPWHHRPIQHRPVSEPRLHPPASGRHPSVVCDRRGRHAGRAGL
jgi:L,D-transpeptidase ErfK/SrfK